MEAITTHLWAWRDKGKSGVYQGPLRTEHRRRVVQGELYSWMTWPEPEPWQTRTEWEEWIPRSPTLRSPARASSAQGSPDVAVNRGQPLRQRAGEEQRMDLGVTRVTGTASIDSYVYPSIQSRFSSYQRSSLVYNTHKPHFSFILNTTLQPHSIFLHYTFWPPPTLPTSPLLTALNFSL